MGIIECEICGYQFTWKEIPRGHSLTNTFVCRKCGTKHTLTKRSWVIFSLMIGLMGYIFNVSINIYKLLPLYMGVVLMVLFFLTVTLLFPYFAKYKVNQKQ
ncbi:MAG: hypothetical protein K6T88_21260 [Bacillus sp. (in: Bacteria)]|nr:hypothetical protein [Bacillus sp. (in: firmicutes)]